MFDTSYFEKLQDYIQNECKTDLNQDEIDYYNALFMIIGVFRKYGRTNAINLLMHKPFNCSRYVANRMFSESINLFFVNDKIERDAYRNMIFNNLMDASLVTLKSAKTVADMEVYGKLQLAAYKIKGLDKPDPKVTKIEDDRDIKIYTIKPESVGIPAINRAEIANLIDNLDIKESEKTRLRKEASIEDIDFEEIIDDTKEKTKDAK